MKLIDQLADDVIDNPYFKSLLQKGALLSASSDLDLPEKFSLSDKEFRDVLRFADILSNSNYSHHRNKAYQVVTHLNETFEKNPIYQTVSKAIYSRMGNFPAINFLERSGANEAELPALRFIQSESKKLIQAVPDTDGLVFTDSQFELYTKLTGKPEFSFSGPTSMGKSFLIKSFIKQVIKNNPPENLVLIVPTRALINQFSVEFKEDMSELLDKYRYKVATNSNITELVTKEEYHYVLVLTPERLISYLTQDINPPIGYLFVDEAHKLANEKDSRSVTTYTAIENTIKKYGNVKLYFSSPNVSNPNVFLSLFNRKTERNSYKTDESPVSQNLYFISLIDKSIQMFSGVEEMTLPVNGFFKGSPSVLDIVKRLGTGKNNLIYCNSKARTIQGAQSFRGYTQEQDVSDGIQRAIKQVKEYIHPEYYLADLLSYRIAFHHGKLPQLIRNLVEDLYKREEVKNVFCTSTLLEGVNMPTQNIFILDNRNGLKKLEPIDFWNLSGRAGRLNKELQGNIFCLEHESCIWDDKGLLSKKDIELKPTVLTKVDRNLKRIEKLLLSQEISAGSQEEEYILKYIANIISVDTLELDSNYVSPLIQKLIDKNKNKIIDLAKNSVEGFEIPSSILRSNQSINLRTQNDVFNVLLKANRKNEKIVLPSGSQISYEVCKSVLTRMHKLYQWSTAEKKLQNINSINYYALLMNQWINGFSLSQIIAQSIDWHGRNNALIRAGFNRDLVEFEPGNVGHMNIVIEKIIDDIEYVLRFLLEKYFNHYYQILLKLLGENDAGENWASLLEYGTQNRIVIALQNIGLSRSTSLKIYREHRLSLTIEDKKLKSVSKAYLLEHFHHDSLEHDEVRKIL